MCKKNRYPKISIRSKNELAKHISGPSLPFSEALELINDVLGNHDDYWHDSKKSEPKKKKYVRSAVNTPLGRLLKLIDKKVLRPHDQLVPDFIFGGLSKRNHIQAAHSLLGKQRGRVLLGLDITLFFEQVSEQRVYTFFHKKCHCSARAASLLAHLCCVPTGPKGSGATDRYLARGFATSSRLSVWCNLDIFLRLKWKAQRKLRKHDPKIAVFVDDIGITASRVSKKHMEKVANIIEDILLRFDQNQSLPLNKTKTKIRTFSEGAEQLGVMLGRSKLGVGGKTRSKRDKIRHELQQPISKAREKELIHKYQSYHQYEKTVSSVGTDID